MSSLRIIIRKFRLMDINSVIDNEESRFIYVRNVFPVQWVGFIKKWAANLPLYGGTCISGRKSSGYKYGITKEATIFAIIGR